MAASYGGRGEFFPRWLRFLASCDFWDGTCDFQILCNSHKLNMVLESTVSISASTPLYSSDVMAILKLFCSSRRLKLYTGWRWSSNQIAAGHSRKQTDATRGLECDCFITSDELWRVASMSMQRIVIYPTTFKYWNRRDSRAMRTKLASVERLRAAFKWCNGGGPSTL